jgi:nitrous oxide reductase accessory protein NosL
VDHFHPEATLKSFRFILAIVVAAFAGCAQSPQEITAPKIHFGQDMCAKCSMIISDERHAGAIGIRKDGRISYLLFDDVGEMLEYDPGESDETKWFATSGITREWLDAETAVFLHSERLLTPMGTGVGAYANLEEASAVQVEFGGEFLTFQELRPNK